MQKFLDMHHAEPIAPPVTAGRWYIPVFPVYHKKKGKVRLVFDSSAHYHNKSLNDALLQGPNQNNRLYGVLIRFREHQVAVCCDIESMFHCFYVNEEDRDYLRFFWWQGNDPAQEVIEYRMNVHLFGNRSSPGVAIYCLQHAASMSRDDEVERFVKRNFYVDDGLASFATCEDAIRVLSKTCDALIQHKIRLHKLMSNEEQVLCSFPTSEHAEKSIDGTDTDQQRILGVSWSVSSDTFHVKYARTEEVNTKRTLLSTINSVYDPLGIVSPVVLKGRHLLRLTTSKKYMETTGQARKELTWDEHLPDTILANLRSWLEVLPEVVHLCVNRIIIDPAATTYDLHIFADASDIAIGNVLYARSASPHGITVRFIQGESKVFPLHANSIPRLELCAAVAAVSQYRNFKRELTRQPETVTFYTDSKVVLGYLQNNSRAFTKYITSRVTYILAYTSVNQWKYVNTKENPADIATRGLSPSQLKESIWFTGPQFLHSQLFKTPQPETYTKFCLRKTYPHFLRM